MVLTLRCRKRGRRVPRRPPARTGGRSDPLTGQRARPSSDEPASQPGRPSGEGQNRRSRVTARVAPDPWCAGAAPPGPTLPSADTPGVGRHSLSHGAAFQTWSAPTGRQGMIPRPMGMSHHATQSQPGASASATRAAGASTSAGRRLAHHHFPEPRGGPHPASLSCRVRACDLDGPTRPRIAAARKAVRSSGLHDKAHADRRQPRGRNPRGGAGR
jgi:hypothetical protein